MPEKANGQTPTQYELHRRQERMDSLVADNTRRINELEKCQARIDTRLNSIAKTLERHTDDSEREMQSMDGKLDHLINYPAHSSRTDMIWGGLKLTAFILILIATSSTAVVMLL